MASTGRIIILAGAPDAASLTFNESELPARYELPFLRFLDESRESSRDFQPALTPSNVFPHWRLVNMERRSENGQHRSDKPGNIECVTARATNSTKGVCEDDGSIDSLDFLDHSLLLLESTLPSQLLPTSYNQGDDATNTAFLATTSFDSDLPLSNLPSTPTEEPPAKLRSDLSLTGLKHVPSAQYIDSIYPQTPTLNLLVAIVALQPRRVVNLRRRTGEMEIRELIVGDETRSGFGVNLWLEPVVEQTAKALPKGKDSRKPAQGNLREQLEMLRVGDVVVMENVALGTWQNAVYGQSLPSYGRLAAKTRMSKVLIDGERQKGGVEFEMKLGRVREWSKRFVGGQTRFLEGSQRQAMEDPQMLPPDTQD